MSDVWDRYTGLLAELEGLDEQEARSVAAAEAARAAEARRLQSILQSAERQRTDQRASNSRVQVAVRELVRSVGVTVPAESPAAPLAASEIGPVLRSVEYDLAELRRSIQHVKAQRHALAPRPAPIPPRPAPSTASQDLATGSSTGGPGTRTAGIALLSALVLVAIVLAVTLL